jgi:chromosome partitioning protein
MLTISVAARKGGQARSTTCFHLAGAFAALGLRVVVIDCDPQPTVSKLLLGSAAVDALAPERTLAAVYDDTAIVPARQVVYPTGHKGIMVIPGGEGSAAYDHPDPERRPELAHALAAFAGELADWTVDVVLIDTAPNAALLTYSTLVAADGVLTPVVPELNAVQELQFLRRLIERVRAADRPGLRWLGVFAASYARRLALHRAYHDQVAAAFPDAWLPVAIAEAALVKEAAVARQPLPLWRPRSPAAKAYTQLAAAILARAGEPNTEVVVNGQEGGPGAALRQEHPGVAG